MRKQIAAANWKMNGTIQQAQQLMDEVMGRPHSLNPLREVIIAVPFPYLGMAASRLGTTPHVFLAAQNCHQKKNGAFTGEVSAEMLQSMHIPYVIIGHSERREYFHESHAQLAEKVDISLSMGVSPIFCCGEPLAIREAGTQNNYVAEQLKESLFHLPAEALQKVVIAYEPIWAIGTGKTATAEQAQEMHAHIRKLIEQHYGAAVSEQISILYGGSVKASNAAEIFGKKDVDGGLVGGASLNAQEFSAIIAALK